MSKMPQKLQEWIDARKRYRLSDAHIQMARELGMKPSSFGKMTPNKDQQWKVSLADYIEHLYEKRFKRSALKFHELRKWLPEHQAEFRRDLHTATKTPENASPASRGTGCIRKTSTSSARSVAERANDSRSN